MPVARDDQRGATLVEAAFVTLPFLLIVMAILEFGLVFRTDLTVNNASQRGGRAASVGGRDLTADFLIIDAVRHGLDDGGIRQVERVIVYQAASVGAPVPASCLAIDTPIGPNGVADTCNVYGTDAFTAPLESTPGVPSPQWQCSPTARDRFWCPTDREASLSSGPRDYVGVYIETTHQLLTGLFGSTMQVDATTITRIEPETA